MCVVDKQSGRSKTDPEEKMSKPPARPTGPVCTPEYIKEHWADGLEAALEGAQCATHLKFLPSKNTEGLTVPEGIVGSPLFGGQVKAGDSIEAAHNVLLLHGMQMLRSDLESLKAGKLPMQDCMTTAGLGLKYKSAWGYRYVPPTGGLSTTGSCVGIFVKEYPKCRNEKACAYFTSEEELKKTNDYLDTMTTVRSPNADEAGEVLLVDWFLKPLPAWAKCTCRMFAPPSTCRVAASFGWGVGPRVTKEFCLKSQDTNSCIIWAACV